MIRVGHLLRSERAEPASGQGGARRRALQRRQSGAVDELKEYVGIIWIGDDPGIRSTIWARSADEARAKAEEREEHVYTVHNEADARRPR